MSLILAHQELVFLIPPPIVILWPPAGGRRISEFTFHQKFLGLSLRNTDYESRTTLQ
jgi:hypothetical protein